MATFYTGKLTMLGNRQLSKSLHTMTTTNDGQTLPNSSRQDPWAEVLRKIGLNRDQESFKALFVHFAPRIKGYLLTDQALVSSEIAEELVQEVMSKVWNKAEMFDGNKSNASTWIYRIARNTKIDYLRSQSKHDQHQELLDADTLWDDNTDHQPFVYLKQSRDQQCLSTLLNRLPHEQKDCLMKIYLQGKTHAELALELGLPIGTVKSRIRLGLKRLQSWMAGREDYAND